MSENRLRRFFIDEGSHYCIRKEVRDIAPFAHHSALKDPPFMRMDIITCRNLMIYLERELQRQLLALFRYALKPGRVLFLGSAESVDTRPELFAPCDRETWGYAAKPRSSRDPETLTQLPREHRLNLPDERGERCRDREKAPPITHATALETLAPPSALVDKEHRTLNLSTNAGQFIRPSEGPLSRELPDIVHPELRAELRRALHSAIDRNHATITLPASVKLEAEQRRVLMHVMPVPGDETVGRKALVLFLDAGPSSRHGGGEDASALSEPAQVLRLEEELRATQDRLSASRREHEVSIQELRMANEKLQSIKEELSTVNGELQSKLNAVASAHSDLRNLVNATGTGPGMLLLDGELRINMLTPVVEQLFSVTDSDVGRPITDFTHKLACDGIERDAAKVLRDLSSVETEVQTQDGHWLMMRLRPYRTVEDRIEGVVVSFVDITELRQAADQLRESEARYRRLFDTMDEGCLLAEVIRDEAATSRPTRRRCGWWVRYRRPLPARDRRGFAPEW
ncbi:chemotaxis methyltransferase CheR [Jannaschia seosinensis]|uniref:Chemotaxis methyltransferase CheR n=2 Tax=Jannaschia seosinensis TaxID=313367 RepID=A0A0M7B5D8_9RHOB|nr:chemotaxis methyltransferase CheR [Jannaschia seosinensis]